MIGGFIVIVAIMAVGATLLTKATVRLMGRYGGESIRRLHTNAEFIVHHHKVPPLWRERLERRLRGLRDETMDPARREVARERARKLAIRWLDELIRHFGRTSLVVDEEARDILTSELRAARAEWADSDWPGISS